MLDYKDKSRNQESSAYWLHEIVEKSIKIDRIKAFPLEELEPGRS